MPHATGSLLEALSDAVGPAHVLSDPDHDYTRELLAAVPGPTAPTDRSTP